MDAVAVPAVLQAWTGLPHEGSGKLVPRLQYDIGKRAGAGGRYLRALRQHSGPQRDRPVAAEDLSLCRGAAEVPRHRVAGEDGGYAAQLDRTQRGRGDPLRRRDRWQARGDSGLYDAPGYHLRRDVLCAGTRTSLGGEDDDA